MENVTHQKSDAEVIRAVTDNHGYFAVGNVPVGPSYCVEKVECGDLVLPASMTIGLAFPQWNKDFATGVLDMMHYAFRIGPERGVTIGASPPFENHSWFLATYPSSGWAAKVRDDQRQTEQKLRELGMKWRPLKQPKQEPDVAAIEKLGPEEPRPARGQEEPIAAIEKVGGKVRYNEGSPERPIVHVDFSRTELTDAGLRACKKSCVNLREWVISPGWLSFLQEMFAWMLRCEAGRKSWPRRWPSPFRLKRS